MNEGRLTVRFNDTFATWIAGLAADEATAVRALMVLGAATLGLPNAAHEARRVLHGCTDPALEAALYAVADTRQTPGRQSADNRQTVPITPHPPASASFGADDPLVADDPFASVGFDV